MFLLETNIGLILLETVISMYLFSTYNDVRVGKEGNILQQWEDKNKEKKFYEKDNSFFGNVFKKQYNEKSITWNNSVFFSLTQAWTYVFH